MTVPRLKPNLDAVKMKSKDGYHHGDLRRTLLRAARRLLEKAGPEGLSLRAVATAAGVSHAAPYHHFANREALVAAIATDAFDDLATALDGAASRHGPPTSKLVSLGAAYVRFATDHPARFALMFGPVLARKREHPALEASSGRALGILHRATEAVLGTSGRASADATLASWSFIHGLSTLLVDGALEGHPLLSRSPEETAKALSEMLVVGMAQRARLR